VHVMGHAGVINKKTYISKPRWKEGRVKGRVGKRNVSRDALERGTHQRMHWEEGHKGGRDASRKESVEREGACRGREHVEGLRW
jgi:hypothetical protein